MTCDSCQQFGRGAIHRGTDGGYCAYHQRPTTVGSSCLFWMPWKRRGEGGPPERHPYQGNGVPETP
jgi:hypothetical protein